MSKRLALILEHMGACRDAIRWAEEAPPGRKAWYACKRADWMIWLLRRTGVPLDRFVDIVQAFANQAQYLKTNRDSPHLAEMCSFEVKTQTDIIRAHFNCPILPRDRKGKKP